MATFTFTKRAPADEFLLASFDDGPLELGSHSKTYALFVEDEQGDRIVLKGNNLKYEEGVLVSGKVNTIVFSDSEGREYATIKGTSLHVADLTSTNPLTLYDTFMLSLEGKDTVRGTSQSDFIFGLGGKDKLFGAAGNDILSGDLGNDVYHGGSGSDLFYASGYVGNDVVLDFDARGGPGKQDFIYTGNNEYTLSSVNKGRDTLVEFNEGDGSVLIKNVKMGQITDADFQFAV